MMDWIGAAAMGLLGVAAMFGFAALRGASPRRLVWQDLSSVPAPSRAERAVIERNVRASFTVYVPVLVAAGGVAGYLISGGEPLGLAMLIAFGLPPLLAIVRAIRVIRFLRSTARRG